MKKLKKAEMVRRGQVFDTQSQHLHAYACVSACLTFTMWSCLRQGLSYVRAWHHIPSDIIIACQIDHVRAERDVLAEVHNPYVVKLYYSFQVCLPSALQQLLQTLLNLGQHHSSKHSFGIVLCHVCL